MALRIIPEREEPDKPACKGRFFRFIENHFTGKADRMVFLKELRPLKSISCEGCTVCSAIMADVGELLLLDPHGAIQFSDELTHGDTVTLQVAGTPGETVCYQAVKVKKGSAMSIKRMKIRGSETPDHPEGIVVSRKQAERIAANNMPKDLKAAGFESYVTDGARGWNLCYGKAVPSSRTTATA